MSRSWAFFLDGRDINREMVREGYAWIYQDHVKDRSLFNVEHEAREAKRGLWPLAEVQRMPPWKWRKVKKAGGPRANSSQILPEMGSFNWSNKRYCKEITSCAETKFYLQQCRLLRLNGGW